MRWRTIKICILIIAALIIIFFPYFFNTDHIFYEDYSIKKYAFIDVECELTEEEETDDTIDTTNPANDTVLTDKEQSAGSSIVETDSIPEVDIIEENTESQVNKPIVLEPEETQPVRKEEEPGASLIDVDEFVYATSNVNIRVGPGIEYEKIGGLKTNECVKRIGICSNGWSKIVYDGVEYYVSSNYLTTSKPIEQVPTAPRKFVPTGSYAVPDFSIYNEEEKAILDIVLEKINENKNNLEIHEEMIEIGYEISFQSYYKIASFFYVYYGQKRAVDETFDFVKTTSKDGVRYYVNLRYDDIRQFESDMVVVRNRVDNILSCFDDGDEEYILKQISEYLRKNITYTYGKYSLQNALLEGQSVCNGYALAFNMLASRAGIKSDLCIGEASNGEYHAWNRVTLSDGSQYFYDITWYDGNSGPNNKYIHSKTNFHGSYLINDYNACWHI